MSGKIAVIDDQEDILHMIEAILVKYGYEVITDTTGAVLENAEASQFDLIILDINLGDKDGAEICAKLKAGETTRNIPIILISAKMDLVKISAECGAEDYLPKPFRIPDLIGKVRTNLQAA
jgi:DNA-binding response OmpR family regulator